MRSSLGKHGEKIILKTQKISLPDYPEAHNPSLIEFEEGYLLIFRYTPDLDNPLISYIGVALLDKEFNVISKPQIVDARFHNPIPSQAEDARVFRNGEKLYLIFNDNPEEIYISQGQRRDMYLAELFYEDNIFKMRDPLKLFHEKKYSSQLSQKNWVPFLFNGMLFLTYTLNPHEVLLPNLKTGACFPMASSSTYLQWAWGEMRPSSPPLMVNGEYLSFFHSSLYTSSPISNGYPLWHFFLGAYAFSPNPPFEITKISPAPLVGKDFYTTSKRWKVVLYPGGFVVDGEQIYMAYGKNDEEIWIATLDTAALLKSMVELKSVSGNIYESD